MKKLLALVLVCMFALTGLAFAEEELPELHMGTNATFPPYEFYDDETGEIVGIDAEIAAAICDKLGYTLVIDDMEFDATIPALTTGKIDFIMAGMTVTEERAQSVDFTDSYATGVQAIIVPEDSPITTAADLTTEGNNYSVGVQAGTTGDIYCTGDIQDAGLGTVQQYKNGADAVLALTSGKVDCVVIDNEPAKNFVAANEGLKILDTEYVREDYAIAVQKGSELLEQINTALQELKADGTIDAIINKYIPAEVETEAEADAEADAEAAAEPEAEPEADAEADAAPEAEAADE